MKTTSTSNLREDKKNELYRIVNSNFSPLLVSYITTVTNDVAQILTAFFDCSQI